jgi:hypothetical protein
VLGKRASVFSFIFFQVNHRENFLLNLLLFLLRSYCVIELASTICYNILRKNRVLKLQTRMLGSSTEIISNRHNIRHNQHDPTANDEVTLHFLGHFFFAIFCFHFFFTSSHELESTFVFESSSQSQ